MWGRGHWNICKWSPRGDTNFMGLEFSSANLNNQMWEQKKKKNELPPAPPSQPPPPQLCTSSFNPHLRPHLCSLLPGPHIRGAQYVQTLIRISLRGRGREEKWGGGGGGGGGGRGGGSEERRRGASVPDQAELPAPDYDTIFSAGFPASSCFCEYGA